MKKEPVDSVRARWIDCDGNAWSYHTGRATRSLPDEERNTGMRGISRGIAESHTAVADESAGLCARSSTFTIGIVAAGVAALTAGAWLSVPFYPVPLTMQTLAVLVVGGLLGPRLGVAAVAGYLALGLSGAPVFHAGTGGPAVLLGPTGGYLIGFLPAVLLMGLVAQRVRAGRSGRGSSVRALAGLAGGTILAEVAIYALGVPWLALAYTGGDLGKAIALGVVPYLLGDMLKMAVAIGAVRMGSRALGRRELLPF